MSAFATLRRKRDKSRGNGAGKGTVLVPESKSEPLFNSTPNLHKIHPIGGKGATSFSKSKKGMSPVFYPVDEDVIVDDCDESRYGGFGNRRSSSSVADSSCSQDGERKFSFQGKSKAQSSTGSLRHFASMISMFGSLKRTKSTKRMVYDSTQDLDPEKRETTEFMRHRAAGRRSPDPDIFPVKSGTASIHSTDSESLGEKRDKSSMTSNTEPGVRSSSSSDEDENRRNCQENFKKVSTNDKNNDDQDSDYTTTKTEEELQRTKIMIQGIKKFNMDPKKGIEFLVENDILQNTADDVAKFLKFGEGLSKMAIGKYLGEHVDFNEEVLQAFLDLHDFKSVILVQALRDFLWSFRLPGESQKIDRMMEAFAKRYCQLNPGIFSCTDTCYLLSYSIIMLNTTLHNPSVKDKPSVEQFIQMNRDVDLGKSLNRDFLVRSYNSILAEPFKIPPEDANDLVLTFFNPNIEGWLWKQGAYKTWKRRWFILSNNCLYYFKFTTDKSPRGIIPLENVNAREVSSNSKSSELFHFILYKKSSSDVIKTCKTLSNGNTVLSQYVTITVASKNEEERKKWVFSINENNSNSDFYDTLTRKKQELERIRQQQQSVRRKQRPEAESYYPPRKDTPIRKPVRKSHISQPSTAPGFEYKDKLHPDLFAPEGPNKDPTNYFKNFPVFSSTASISSGSGIEKDDSSYGSFSDISRSRSESRILDCTNDGSISSVEHDTGSIGNQDADQKDQRFDLLPKKLSVIEESQNLSDRSSNSSGANILEFEEEKYVSSSSTPVALGYRKLSEEKYYDDEVDSLVSHKSAGASSSDSGNCDNCQVSSSKVCLHKIKYASSRSQYNELSTVTDGASNDKTKQSTPPFSRSRSIESDV